MAAVTNNLKNYLYYTFYAVSDDMLVLDYNIPTALVLFY